MKMKKINLDKVKNFLFDHGEKVALGACIFVALLLGLLGIFRASGAARDEKSGRTWAEALKKEYDRIRAGIDSAKPTDQEKTDKVEPTSVTRWDPTDLGFIQAQYTQLPEGLLSRRENPKVLAVNPDIDLGKKELKNVQLEYFHGLVFKHEYGKTVVKNKPINAVKGFSPAAGGKEELLHAGLPTRFVVGTMVFPMKLQVAEFVRALRMKNQSELFMNKEDLPRPTGFNLVKFELLPNGQPVNPAGEIMIHYDPKEKKLTVSNSLKNFLRDVMYDEKFPQQLEPYIFGTGLVMPTPLLANGRLAKLELEGISVPDGLDETDPKKPMVAGGVVKKGEDLFKGLFKDPRKPKNAKEPDPEAAEGKTFDIEEKLLPPALAARLFKGNFNIFHPLGEFEPTLLPPGKGGQNPVVMPNQPAQQGERYFAPWQFKEIVPPGEEKPPMPMEKRGELGVQIPEIPDWDRDAIVRFIDPDVEVGKTYAYAIQVRFANPNFGKGNAVVAFEGLAQLHELPLDNKTTWVTTRSIRIPDEYGVYAVDQPLLDNWAGKAPPGKPVPLDPKVYKDSTSFQVHRWVKKHDDGREEFVIGDWVIAEHLLVRRGDFIGLGAMVQVPVWFKERNSFALKDSKDTKKGPAGMRMDLLPPAPDGDKAKIPMSPPILVDFHGGKKFKGASPNVEEESAVDALIMTAQGRLVVLNSRDASETSDPRNFAARERQERLSISRHRVAELGGRAEK